MLLYLRDENQLRIDTIELVDGCFPRITVDIGGDNVHCLPPATDCSVTKLEPAVWGIILVLDTVWVDCGRRRFRWATTRMSNINDKEGTYDPSYETQYAGDECYDYNDDVDELFSLAQDLIKISKMRTGIPEKTQEYLNSIKDEHYSLIRMLYCYIFPKVQLYTEDFPMVQEAISKQTTFIQRIDNLIERHSEMLDTSYQVLQNQQDERLDQFNELLAMKKCTKKFLKIFEKDLNKRIDQLNEKLDEKQIAVQAIKDDIKEHGETVERTKQLEEARGRSAICHQTLQRLLLVSRDTIKTALMDSNNFLNKDNEEIVLDYLKSTEISVKQKIAANSQMDKKVRATSILQNLKRILEEVKTDGVASSTTNGLSGKRPTDVIPESHVPEYQTLSERVSDIVKNPEHPLGEEFQKFVSTIQQRCQDILDDAQKAEYQKVVRRSKKIDSYLIVGNDGTIQQEYLSQLEGLCCDIKRHFSVMAANLLEHFNSSSTILRNKLQLCYEENFYNAVGEDIAKVYSMAHQHHEQKMILDLELITTLPINCLELGMKDEWWLDLFEKRRMTMVSSRSSSYEKISAAGTLEDGKSDEIETSSSSTGSLLSVLDQGSPKNQPTGMRRSARLRKSILGLIQRISRQVSESSLGLPASPDVTNGLHNSYESCKNSQSEWPNGSLTNEVYTSQSPTDHNYQAELSKFEEYFGPSLECLKNVFKVSPVFGKLQCLTMSLRKVTQSVQELRRQVLQKSASENSEVFLAITGDDILPLIVLMILQMEHSDAAALQGQLKMMEDLIPKFLSAGCHGWAMMEFEMACQVLLSLCSQCDWTDSLHC